MEKTMTMITIPLGYTAISIEERDNLLGNIAELSTQIVVLDKKLSEIRELCLEEAKDHAGVYRGSLYVDVLAKIIGFELD